MVAPYTKHELETMLADLESDLVERKESLQGDNPRKLRQAVCAFANDLPDHQRPGVVFVGADDAGAPVGLEITDQLLLQLADVKTDGNIVPPPTLTVDTRVLLGTPVAVVTVMPSDAPPVRHRGRIWIRVGPRRAIASAQDERILPRLETSRTPSCGGPRTGCTCSPAIWLCPVSRIYCRRNGRTAWEARTCTARFA